MSYIDLHSALRDWPHEPDQVSVRKILGTDGSVRIQMRVELGILQMETQGRPDGLRPHDADSLLAHHQEQLADYERRNGTTLGYVLSPRDCQALRAEASMFYRRYVSLFVLEEFAAVVKDTSHSLAVFDLCRDHAFEKQDREFLEPYRPYVLMMDARARAYQALQDGEPAAALAHVNRGILQVKNHLERTSEGASAETADEMKILQALGAELAKKIPPDSLVVTRRALRTAIEQERFEDAARLRDAIHNRHNHNQTGAA